MLSLNSYNCKSPAGKLRRGNERGLTRRAEFVSEPIKPTFIISVFCGLVLVLFVPIVSIVAYLSAMSRGFCNVFLNFFLSRLFAGGYAVKKVYYFSLIYSLAARLPSCRSLPTPSIVAQPTARHRVTIRNTVSKNCLLLIIYPFN